MAVNSEDHDDAIYYIHWQKSMVFDCLQLKILFKMYYVKLYFSIGHIPNYKNHKLVKVIIAQMVKKFLSFYVIRRFITAYTIAVY